MRDEESRSGTTVVTELRAGGMNPVGLAAMQAESGSVGKSLREDLRSSSPGSWFRWRVRSSRRRCSPNEDEEKVCRPGRDACELPGPTGGLLSRPDGLDRPRAQRPPGWQREGQERQ